MAFLVCTYTSLVHSLFNAFFGFSVCSCEKISEFIPGTLLVPALLAFPFGIVFHICHLAAVVWQGQEGEIFEGKEIATLAWPALIY